MIKQKVQSYSIGDTIKEDKLVVANRVSAEGSVEYLGWDAEKDAKSIASADKAELQQLADTESYNKALECTTADDFSSDPVEEEVDSDTIVDAINNAEGETILTVTDDIVLEETLSIPEGKKITLDLGDKSLTINSEEQVEVLVNDGELTLKDGSITGWKVVNNGDLIVEGTAFESTAGAVTGACAIQNNGTLTFNSGSIHIPFEGSTSDPGGPACIRNANELTINGGSFTSKSKRTYCIIQSDGMTTVNAPEEEGTLVIEGTHGGIAVDGGNAVINGGDYSSSEYYGLYVSNDHATAGVTVNDGTFTGKIYSVWVGSDHSTGVEAAVKINGGTFEKQLKDQSNVSAGWGTKIYGGNFKVEPVADMIPEGYKAIEDIDTGYWVVKPESVDTPVAPIEDQGENIDDTVDEEL